MNSKTQPGNYFEDFRLGQEIIHATPRTVTEGDVALYTALFGSRFALNSSSEFAVNLGLPRAPLDSLLAFHLVFGKTVPDISLNAVANLGYASGRFGQPVYPGDTLSTISTVIGIKQNRDGKTGIVYVRSVGSNQRQETVIDYIRWVMVRKRDIGAPAPETVVPIACRIRRCKRVSGSFPSAGKEVRHGAIRQPTLVGGLRCRGKNRPCRWHDH